MLRSNVVLPAPLEPSSATISPSGTLRLTPRRASTTSSYTTSRFRAVSMKLLWQAPARPL